MFCKSLKQQLIASGKGCRLFIIIICLFEHIFTKHLPKKQFASLGFVFPIS